MDYQALIDETKNKITNYSFDDSTYKTIYNEAKLRLDNAYKAGEKNINSSLKQSSQQAIGDNALATKSLQESLAMRGLARSGESAMLKLNQQISLNNALARLTSEAASDKNKLYADYQEQLANISTDLGKQKAAAIESEKTALYNRLGDLEKLKADDDRWRAEFNASMVSGSGGGGSGSSDGGNKEEEATGHFDPLQAYQGFMKPLTNNDGRTPGYSAEKVAENILLTCGVDDGIIRSNVMQSRIYKELARLVIASDFSTEYTMDVLGILRSHGFNVEFNVGLIRSDKVQSADYVYQTAYRNYYAALIRSGFATNEAAVRAKQQAKDRTAKYLKTLKLSEDDYNNILDMMWMLN